VYSGHVTPFLIADRSGVISTLGADGIVAEGDIVDLYRKIGQKLVEKITAQH
jgi:hypothetical protein